MRTYVYLGFILALLTYHWWSMREAKETGIMQCEARISEIKEESNKKQDEKVIEVQEKQVETRIVYRDKIRYVRTAIDKSDCLDKPMPASLFVRVCEVSPCLGESGPNAADGEAGSRGADMEESSGSVFRSNGTD